MPSVYILFDLQYRLARLTSRIEYLEDWLQRIDHQRTAAIRDSPRDRHLWALYRRLDDYIDDLKVDWQNLTDQIERLTRN